MICPNCRRQMGDKLICDYCGFAFRLPNTGADGDAKKIDVALPSTDDEVLEIPSARLSAEAGLNEDKDTDSLPEISSDEAACSEKMSFRPSQTSARPGNTAGETAAAGAPASELPRAESVRGDRTRVEKRRIELPHAPLPSYVTRTNPWPVSSAPSAPARPDSGLEKPLSIGEYIGMFLLALIPVVSIIMSIVWVCSSKSKNRVHFAIALLIIKAVAIMFLIGLVVGYLFLNGAWLMFWM